MRSHTLLAKAVLTGTLAMMVAFFVACEEYIDPPFEIEEPKLVISSNFSPGEKVSVRLSASNPAYGPTRQGEIRNANVKIFGGGQVLDSLVYVPGPNGSPGAYCSLEFSPETDVDYTLLASAPGFTPVTATSSIPTSANITALQVSELESLTAGNGLRLYTFNLTVDYNDPDWVNNFYDLRIRQLVTPFSVAAGTQDTSFFTPVTKTVEAFADATADNTAVGESSYLIKDRVPGGVTLRLVSKIDPKRELLGDLIVELRTVSQDYYSFQRDVQDGCRVCGIIVEPDAVPVYSNVGGGYGIFAGYNPVVRQFPLLD